MGEPLKFNYTRDNLLPRPGVHRRVDRRNDRHRDQQAHGETRVATAILLWVRPFARIQSRQIVYQCGPQRVSAILS